MYHDSGCNIVYIWNLLLLMGNANKHMRFRGQSSSSYILKEDISFTEKAAIENKLKDNSSVERFEHVTKDQAFDRMKERMGEDYQQVLSGYTKESHPFPESYDVHLKTVEAANQIEDEFKDMNGVDDVGNDRPTIEAIINISKTLKWVGVFMFLLLGGVSLPNSKQYKADSFLKKKRSRYYEVCWCYRLVYKMAFYY